MIDLTGLVREARVETRESDRMRRLKQNEDNRVLCLYCNNSLPEKPYISKYGGRYCNTNCHAMFTED